MQASGPARDNKKAPNGSLAAVASAAQPYSVGDAAQVSPLATFYQLRAIQESLARVESMLGQFLAAVKRIEARLPNDACDILRFPSRN